MLKHLVCQFLLVLSCATICAAATPRLGLGSATVTRGTATVTLPVTLSDAAGNSLVSVGGTVTYDATKLANPRMSAGPAALAVQKTVWEAVSPTVAGRYTYALLSTDSVFTLSDGIVGNLTFDVLLPAGTTTLAHAADGADNAVDANEVTVDGAGGTVTVTIPTYTLTVNVVGGGTVNNVNAGSPTFAPCSSSSCSASFDAGSVFTLRGTPGVSFTGWSGGCSGTGDCSVTLNANSSVTATFTPIAQVTGSTTSYQSIQSAYDAAAASSSAEVRARNFVVDGNVTLDKAVRVLLKGGYLAGFGASSGFTVVDGTIKVNRGTLVPSLVKVR